MKNFLPLSASVSKFGNEKTSNLNSKLKIGPDRAKDLIYNSHFPTNNILNFLRYSFEILPELCVSNVHYFLVNCFLQY